MSKPDWQNQSYSKSSSASGPSKLNSKITAGAQSTLHSKIARPTQSMGGMVAAPVKKPNPVRKFADGGSVDDETYNSEQYQADKKAGLEASRNEKVGLWERLKAGNIDDPSSEAYRRFGAGRGQAERMKSMPDESAAETNRLAAASAAAAPADENESAAETARLARQDAAAAASDAASKSASVPKSFGAAFKAAEDGSTFEWNGKQYKKEYAASASKPTAPKAAAPKAAAADTPAVNTNPATGAKSVVFKAQPATAGGFDPDRVDNFPKMKTEPQPAERKFRQTRAGRIYEDELPPKPPERKYRQTRAGRIYED